MPPCASLTVKVNVAASPALTSRGVVANSARNAALRAFVSPDAIWPGRVSVKFALAVTLLSDLAQAMAKATAATPMNAKKIRLLYLIMILLVIFKIPYAPGCVERS
jgi:hypothetical protein